jgi:hypothetical protein
MGSWSLGTRDGKLELGNEGMGECVPKLEPGN